MRSRSSSDRDDPFLPTTGCRTRTRSSAVHTSRRWPSDAAGHAQSRLWCWHRRSSRLGRRRDRVRRSRGRRPAADRAGRARRDGGADPLRERPPRRRRDGRARRRGTGSVAPGERGGARRARGRAARARRLDLAPAWPADFPDDIAVQRRSPYEARADAIMYRQVLAELAHARGWEVHFYDAKTSSTRRPPARRAGRRRPARPPGDTRTAVDEGPPDGTRRDVLAGHDQVRKPDPRVPIR